MTTGLPTENTRPQPAPPAWTFTITKEGTLGCNHSWAGTNFLAVCLKCDAEGVWKPPHSTPPEGEPDFMRDAENFARKENAPFGVERLLRTFGERMYRLGLSARQQQKGKP